VGFDEPLNAYADKGVHRHHDRDDDRY